MCDCSLRFYVTSQTSILALGLLRVEQRQNWRVERLMRQSRGRWRHGGARREKIDGGSGTGCRARAVADGADAVSCGRGQVRLSLTQCTPHFLLVVSVMSYRP